MGFSPRKGDQGLLPPGSCDAYSDAQAAFAHHTAGFLVSCPDRGPLALPEQISGVQSPKDHN